MTLDLVSSVLFQSRVEFLMKRVIALLALYNAKHSSIQMSFLNSEQPFLNTHIFSLLLPKWQLAVTAHEQHIANDQTCNLFAILASYTTTTGSEQLAHLQQYVYTCDVSHVYSWFNDWHLITSSITQRVLLVVIRSSTKVIEIILKSYICRNPEMKPDSNGNPSSSGQDQIWLWIISLL